MTKSSMTKLLLRSACALALCGALAACKTSEEQAEEYYQSGLELLAQGDPARAMIQFRNVFEVKGDHYEARRKLAETLLASGDSRSAYSQFLRLAEQYPDDLDTRVSLSQLAFRALNWDEFERHVTKAQELSPSDPRVVALDAALRYRAGTQQQDSNARLAALADAEAALANDPANPVLLNVVIDGAAQAKNLQKAGPLLDRLLADDPTNALYYRQKLAMLVEEGDTAKLEAHLRRTVDAFPEDQEAKGMLLAFYMQGNRLDDAEAFLRELAAEAPAEEKGPSVDLVVFLDKYRGREAANAEIEKILSGGGDPLEFSVLRSTFDFRDGQRDTAIADLTKVLAGAEPSDRSRDVRAILANMLLSTGDVESARKETATILEQNPSHPGALKLQAAWDTQEDDTDAAVASLRLVLDQNPDDVQALMLMAEAHGRAGRSDLSRDFLSKAAEVSEYAVEPTLRLAGQLLSEKRYLPAEDALLNALRGASDNSALLAMLGEVYLAMQDNGRAEGVVARLREVDDPDAKRAADAIETRRVALAEGTDAAMAHLETLAAGSDDDVSARLNLLKAKLLSGNTSEALAIAQTLSDEQPDARGLQAVLALAQAGAGQTEVAAETYRKMIAAEPSDPAPYVALMRMHNILGETAEADKVMDEGLAAAPDNPDLLWGKAGKLEQAGDIDGAIAIYEGLYQRNSNSVIVANNLASLLATYRNHDPASVERAYQIARRLGETQVPAFMDTYGWIAHLRGDSEEALPYLEKAAAALEKDPFVQLHLGLTQAALGKNDDARAQLTKALELAGPNDTRPQIQKARDALAALPASGEASGDTGASTGSN